MTYAVMRNGITQRVRYAAATCGCHFVSDGQQGELRELAQHICAAHIEELEAQGFDTAGRNRCDCRQFKEEVPQ